MALLAAAIVLLLLFSASYWGRGAWIVFGSTVLSAVLIAGWSLLTIAPHAGPFLNTLAENLPNGWNRQAQALATAIGRVSAPSAFSREKAPAQAGKPVHTASVSQWWDGKGIFGILDLQIPDLQSPKVKREQGAGPRTEGTSAPAKHDPQSISADGPVNGPVKWILDVPTTGAGTPVVLTGINVSDEPFEDIRATLKPDSADKNVFAQRGLTLGIRVEGQGTDRDVPQGATVVPPGVRFQLVAPHRLASEPERRGGAIVSFAYVQAGRHRTSIMYLTPTALAGGNSP